MRLTALICNRYRAFKERQRIELAPITLIIGKNGSGKSIISRLPLLLANAISEQADGILDLVAGGVEHATSFQDLVNSKGALPFTLGAEIGDKEQTYTFETTLRYVSETRSLSVERFLLTKNGQPLLSAEISDIGELEKSNQSFDITAGENVFKKTKLDFSGLFPRTDDLEKALAAELNLVFGQFRQALPSPSYLGPFRVEPGTTARNPNQSIRDLGPRGERALDLLADDRLRQGGNLSNMVRDWFSSSMGQTVEVDISGETPQVRVSQVGTEFHVSLADTGAGFSQSLPVVVQHFAYRAKRIKSTILIVEQPELHLHPGAHGAIADLIIDSALGKECSPATCIVETHSEQLIMRIRRRIAEGILEPEIVKLWSLNHVDSDDEPQQLEPLKLISFDKSGNPDSWPIGIFEEAFDDLTLMRRANRDRK